MKHFVIPGPPRGKGRARSTRSGIHYTDKKTRMYESHVLDSYLRVYPSADPLEGAISISIIAYLQRPKSHFGTGKNANILKKNAPHYHTTKPDIDNLVKFYLDCLNGIAWEDDKQIIYIQATKTYSEEPLTSVRIQEHGVQL